MSGLTYELKEAQFSSGTKLAVRSESPDQPLVSSGASLHNSEGLTNGRSYIQGLASKNMHGLRDSTARIANNNTTQRVYRFIRRPLKRGVRAKAKAWLNRLGTMSVSELLYKVALYFLSVVFVGLIVCTMVDMIPQSLVSGQFWNTIIIILTCALIFFFALILYVVRVLDTRRSVNRIPRAYLVQDLGIPKCSLGVLADERKRCIDIYKSQVDVTAIHHPGLSNPGSELGSLGNFMETIESIPHFIEWKIQGIDSRFARPVGCDFRSYLELIVAHHVVDEENTEFVENFVDRFEHARFSGSHITESEFKNLMLAMCSVIVAISRNSQKFGKNNVEPYGVDFDDYRTELESLAGNDAHLANVESLHTRNSLTSGPIPAFDV